MTEQATVRRAIDGDEQAMRQLWVEHAPHVDAVVLRLCGDRELAADIAQDVWIQIFRALPSYRGDAQVSTWIHRIAVNRALNELRKVRRVARMETDFEGTGVLEVEDREGGDEVSDRTFLAETIDQAVRQLSPGARMVFTLHDIEGYTHEEIAQQLGMTTGGSKSQLAKARAKLRRLLAHVVDVPSSTVGQRHATSI